MLNDVFLKSNVCVKTEAVFVVNVTYSTQESTSRIDKLGAV